MIGWDDVSPESLSKFKEKDFERLCWHLVLTELTDRHLPRVVRHGPGASGVGDGGGDLLVSVPRGVTPRLSKQQYADKWPGALALTPDRGRRVYSCKTGRNWQKAVRAETKKRAEFALETLKRGGSFWLFVNEPVDARRKRALKAELAENFVARAENSPSAPHFLGRLRVVDANDLHRFLVHRRPERLPRPLLDVLGVGLPPGSKALDEWALEVERDRELPPYQWDDSREALRDTMLGVFTLEEGPSEQKTIVLFGPPGIGKTRLLLETLQHRKEDLAGRVLVASTSAEGRQLLQGRVFEKFPTSIVLIDDCPWYEVESLVRSTAPVPRRGALVLLVPEQGPREAASPQRYAQTMSLATLAREACEAILRDVLGEGYDPAQIAALVGFTGGYPWFARLMAQEIQQGAQAPRTVTEAAQLVLASRGEEKGEWQEAVWRRARALLAVILTIDQPWDRLSQPQRTALCEAVGLTSWQTLEDEYQRCHQRGLLRERVSGQFKYVTPHILEREVIKMLLAPGPGGPPGLGRRLREHAGGYLHAFLARLPSLGLDAGMLERLALDLVEDLRAKASDLGGYPKEDLHPSLLTFLARQAPGPTGQFLRRLVGNTRLETLAMRTDVRRALVWSLGSIVQRKQGFEAAEEALFRLAVAENEAYGNNATRTWASIFRLPWPTTHADVGVRTKLLAERCRSQEPRARLTALAGVESLLRPHPFAEGPEELDGPAPELSEEQAYRARVAGWRLLLERAQDARLGVSQRARDLLCELLRYGLAEGDLDAVVEELVTLVGSLDASTQAKIRDEVEAASADDEASFRDVPERRGTLEALRRALTPRSFSQRLRMQVGSRRSTTSDQETRAADLALATEGLAPPGRPVLEHLAWLASREALRAADFATALGEVDRERMCLEPLLALARDGGHRLFAAYCSGWSNVAPEQELTAYLVRWQEEQRLAPAVVLAALWTGVTEVRLPLLLRALAQGEPELPEDILDRMGAGGWLDGLSSSSQRLVVEALLARGSAPAAAVALELLTRRDQEKTAEPWQLGLLEASMTRLQHEALRGMAAYAWARGGATLLRGQKAEAACRLALAGVTGAGRVTDHHWALLRSCESQAPEAFWEVLRPALEGPAEQAFSLANQLRGHRVGADLPTHSLAAWVGDDEERATLVAELIPLVEGSRADLLRTMILRFGPESRPARRVSTNFKRTLRAVSSLARFFSQQKQRIQPWLEDPDERVRAWAASVTKQLAGDAEFYEAQEEFERRRFGT